MKSPLSGIVEDPSDEWEAVRACHGVPIDWFFPEREEEGYNHLSGWKVCEQCPVRRDCLAQALLDGEQFGLRAGMSPHSRAVVYAGLRRGQMTWANVAAMV